MAIDAQRRATIRPKASKRRGGLFKNGGKAKYRGQTARRRAERLAAAESSTLQPVDSISVNQDKIEAVKKVIEKISGNIPEVQEEQPIEIPQETTIVQEDSAEEIVITQGEPEVQLKQVIDESDEDYFYEEEPEAKDYSFEYMVNDAIEYPTLIEELEQLEQLEEPDGQVLTETIEDEVSGSLIIDNQ